MRKVIGGNGQDTTAATKAYLLANRNFRFANLFLLGKLEDPAAIFLTDYETDLVWRPWGTFKHATLQRSKMTSKFGLDVEKMDLTWSPPLTPYVTSVGVANPYQLAIMGMYDGWDFRMWRAIIPSQGDCETYGAFDFFGGRVSSIDIVSGALKITANSWLDVMNMMVPQNTIENSNMLAGYVGNQPVSSDGETQIAQFTVAANSNRTNILATCTGPTPGKIYGNNKLQYGYVRFNSGSTLAGVYSGIAQNANFDAGGGVHYNQIIMYAALPWPPSSGDTFYVSAKPPIDVTEGTLGVDNIIFPRVPTPESSL
jgi:hypothetical protein